MNGTEARNLLTEILYLLIHITLKLFNDDLGREKVLQSWPAIVDSHGSCLNLNPENVAIGGERGDGKLRSKGLNQRVHVPT